MFQELDSESESEESSDEDSLLNGDSDDRWLKTGQGSARRKHRGSAQTPASCAPRNGLTSRGEGHGTPEEDKPKAKDLHNQCLRLAQAATVSRAGTGPEQASDRVKQLWNGVCNDSVLKRTPESLLWTHYHLYSR